MPESVDELLPNVVPGPNDSLTPPAWLMQATEEAAASEVQTPLAPPVWFDSSNDSVKFNSELLKESNPDFSLISWHAAWTATSGKNFPKANGKRKLQQ